MRVRSLALVLATTFISQFALAEVKLPSVFGSHMVLQQQKPIVVWGTADPDERVTVSLAQGQQTATANQAGQWRISLPPMTAGGPHTITVSGTNTITLDDVLVGEVWVCSGQSNMEMGVSICLEPEKEVAAANYPKIRLFQIPKTIAAAPASDVSAQWRVCSPETIAQPGWGGFSAAGYFFGRELHKNLDIPVGLIQTAWGGTRIEPWTTADAFGKVPELKTIQENVLLADVRSDQHKQKAAEIIKSTEDWIAAARKAVNDEQPIPPIPALPQQLTFVSNPQTPTGLYNAMIHPLVPFGIRGAIWYQGESNMGEGMLYTKKMQALIDGWRTVWDDEFPFYYTQIAPYAYGEQLPTILPEFWEAQAAALQIANTGMASTIDIGDMKDIHPRNKQEVGRRLALWALNKTYGKSDVVYTGPTFKSFDVNGATVRVSFDNIGGGLASRDGKPLNGFEMIDAETGGFVTADASIDGPYVVLSSKEVTKPAAIRFAWSKSAEPNLINKEGLPAYPFRAGDVPKRDVLSMIAEAKDFQLVYDIDLAKLGPAFSYDVDNSKKLNGAPERVAYLLETTTGDGTQQHVFVSMDAFTSELAKIGIPAFSTGAKFQQPVSNMNVYSNAPGVAQGLGLKAGAIEFWPHNYGGNNATNVAGASSSAYDFGDQMSEPVDGYGSMQVHNVAAKQTVFALNKWSAGSGADLGIGNQKAQNTDWTFAGNAGSYTSKRLRVFAKMK